MRMLSYPVGILTSLIPLVSYIACTYSEGSVNHVLHYSTILSLHCITFLMLSLLLYDLFRFASKIERNKSKWVHFNEDDDNLIYLGSMNPENTSFSSDPETCYYFFLLRWSYLSTAHFHDA